MRSISELLEIIAEEVDALEYGQEPQTLYEPIKYIMSLGGKRMRPLLVLLAYQLQGADAKAAVAGSLSVEVFHNFTLMHDDIMDEAPLRRGKPTVHERWNDNVAILSGDTMLVKAYDHLLHVKPALLPRALRAFNQCAVEVCEGQQWDMNFETEAQVEVEDYLNMIRLKTAVLLGFSLELGGMMAEFSDAQCELLKNLGTTMGIGFQLMDDLLDVYGDQAKFGKQVGGDIVCNKKTFLLINALEQAKGQQKEQLEYWLEKDDFDTEKKVNAVKAIYDELGIREQTQQKMNAYFDEAIAMMDELEGEETAKNILKNFATALMKRES